MVFFLSCYIALMMISTLSEMSLAKKMQWRNGKEGEKELFKIIIAMIGHLIVAG